MKATGIIRRIDDLGRVAIPKEIRRSLSITEGDPLEIFITEDGKGVTYKKYIQEPVLDIIKDLQDAIENDDKIIKKSLLQDKIQELKDMLKVAD